MRDAFFKFDVRLIFYGHAAQGDAKLLMFGLEIIIQAQEFFRHVSLRKMMIGAHGFDELQHGRQVVHNTEINGFDHRPEWKTAVGDDESVRVPHARQQGEELRIEETVIDHGCNLAVRTGRAKKQKTQGGRLKTGLPNRSERGVAHWLSPVSVYILVRPMDRSLTI